MSQQIASVPLSASQEKATTQTKDQSVRRVTGGTIGAMTFLVICTLYFLIPFFWLIV